MQLLSETIPHVDWAGGKKLIYDNVIDSMDIMMIISEITNFYKIEIPLEEMDSANFESVEDIWNLIVRIKNEKKEQV